MKRSWRDLLSSLSPQDILSLICRLGLSEQFIRRIEEEKIASIVPVDRDWLQQARSTLLESQSLDESLSRFGCSETELDLHLWRPKALQIFAESQFGSGLEEVFLAARGGHDQIIYSVLRVRDAGLARELWIRLEEGEATFAELASTYGEGPEAARKGVMGPAPIGTINPSELAQLLRTLQPGEVHPPSQLGEWLVLLRLEQLTPARFDSAMREFLLNQQLDAFLNVRVHQLLHGEQPDDLHYDSHL